MLGLKSVRKLPGVLETLPDDFPVYTRTLNLPYQYVQTDSVPAKHARTDCCDAPPLKYYPDGLEDKDRWWLICSMCHHAIKHNGVCV